MARSGGVTQSNSFSPIPRPRAGALLFSSQQARDRVRAALEEPRAPAPFPKTSQAHLASVAEVLMERAFQSGSEALAPRH